MDLATVQRALIALGYDLGKTGSSGKGDDGTTGRLTTLAVAAYQKGKGLPVDGQVNPATLKALGLAPAIPAVPGFPAEIVAAAQTAEHETRIPAAVSLAQWAIESGYGRFMPAGSNNPFGIKAGKGQPSVIAHTREEHANGSSYYIDAAFRKFATIGEAFVGHGGLLAHGAPYASAYKLLPVSGTATPAQVEAFTREMAKHYATAHNYADVLISLMRSRNLYAID